MIFVHLILLLWMLIWITLKCRCPHEELAYMEQYVGTIISFFFVVPARKSMLLITFGRPHDEKSNLHSFPIVILVDIAWWGEWIVIWTSAKVRNSKGVIESCYNPLCQKRRSSTIYHHKIWRGLEYVMPDFP